MPAIQVKEVEDLVKKLPRDQQFRLVNDLSRYLETKSDQPYSLRGLWKEQFPESFDIENSLKDIRNQWQQEWDSAGNFNK